MEKDFGRQLEWFIGVVEDRMDPEYMGRVKVRCLGHHTENKTEILTEDLSWSTVMAPTNTPAMNGMGQTPPFLVEGTWVTGFFLDKQKQECVVVGSLPGFNQSRVLDTSKGFFDPSGVYPKKLGPDTNELARPAGHGELHDSLITRRANRNLTIPKATKPLISTVESVLEDPRATWDEPQPMSNTPTKYPFNHVEESESGHVREIDDSPGGERIMNYHRTGTFDEIHPDGSKMTKLVGSEYEITLKDKNVYIEGACNITVKGAVRQLIKGDYILEVEGNYTEKIHKNRYTKIGAGESGGNDAFEILGNRSGNIKENENIRINKDTQTTCNGNYNHQVNGNYDQTYIKDFTITANGNMTLQAGKNMSITAVAEDCTLKAGTKMNIRADQSIDMHSESANMIITTATTIDYTAGGAINGTAGGDMTLVGGPNINLN
jgi:hypothetical protein